VSSAGLLVGAAATASAGGHDDHGKDKYGWVKVCQQVNKDKELRLRRLAPASERPTPALG